MSTPGERISVVGLGYVGLPLAVALARHGDVLGFDVDPRRIAELRAHRDRTGEISADALRSVPLRLSSDAAELADRTFHVVTVPTPIDQHKSPDLSALSSASETIGRRLTHGSVVVYESTVYPGVTEEHCAPILERASGLKWRRDFAVGYSPERINPGDREHTLDRVVKVVSGDSPETLERVAAVYGSVVTAGIHRAPSIRVAEAAKVIENTQRDLNIALMNELALIFDRLGIRTRDVLDAAGTKWNFLPFAPGLVGGHCIGVDPYYLTQKAESVGYHPQVILAGRRVNDGMGMFIAQKTVKLLIEAGVTVKGARVGILGLTFKENVRDLRNSRVPDIVTELREFGAHVLVHDPMPEPEAALHEYGIELCAWSDLGDLDGLILAVPHRAFLERSQDIPRALRTGGILVDVKSVLDAASLPAATRYWSP